MKQIIFLLLLSLLITPVFSQTPEPTPIPDVFYSINVNAESLYSLAPLVRYTGDLSGEDTAPFTLSKTGSPLTVTLQVIDTVLNSVDIFSIWSIDGVSTEYGVTTVTVTADNMHEPVEAKAQYTHSEPSPIPTPIPEGPILGDIDGNGYANIVDALMLAQYYVGICDCVSDPVIADVNLDGKVNIIDALLVAQYYVGIISNLPPNERPIEDYNWILQSFGDRDNPSSVITGTEITLQLVSDGLMASGTAGCNGYTGFYEIDGNNISIDRINSNAMFCTDPPGIMQQELDFIGALGGAESFVVNQNTLTIYSSENRILVFR